VPEVKATQMRSPPPGALKTEKWFGRRLIPADALAEALGLDPFEAPALPPAPKKPRGRPFQRRRQPVAAE
jgi:hypothetical protein